MWKIWELKHRKIRDLGSAANYFVNLTMMNDTMQHKSSITAQVGGSDFSAFGNAKYVQICFVVRTGHL
jgi:hypothetical protein